MPKPANPKPTPTHEDVRHAMEFLKNHTVDISNGFGEAPDDYRNAMTAAMVAAARIVGENFGVESPAA